MKVKTDYTKCNYIKAGKIYEVCTDGYSQLITNESGDRIEILAPPFSGSCPHLNCEGFWEVVEDDA